MEDKIPNSFFGSAKELLNKQNSLTRYHVRYIRFLEGFLVTTTTTQKVFINILSNTVTCKIEM